MNGGRSQARAFKLPGVERFEIDMPAPAESHTLGRRVVETAIEPVGQLPIDLIAAHTGGRADPRQQIFRAAPLPQHGSDRRPGDPVERPPPTGVGHADGPPAKIDEEQRDAIGRENR